MKPELLSIAMFPGESFNTEESLGRLLDIFEANPKLFPTRWGNSEVVKVEYDRQEIIEKAASVGRISELYLHRDKAVKYSGMFDIHWNPRSFLKVDFHKSIPNKIIPALFEASDQIAQLVKPVYGVTHMFGPSVYPWGNDRERLQVWMDVCGYPIPVRFFPNGPLGIGVRTYFSGQILEMFGKDFLLSCPGEVRELEWGGVCIDVLKHPEEADGSALLDHWLTAMEYLQSSHVMAIPHFDDDRMGVSFSPNTIWKKYLNEV